MRLFKEKLLTRILHLQSIVLSRSSTSLICTKHTISWYTSVMHNTVDMTGKSGNAVKILSGKAKTLFLNVI